MSIVSWKHVLALVVSLGALVVTVLAFSIHVDRYANMPAAQVDAQDERQITELVAACRQAGGDWSTTMTAGGCNVSFQQPDESWYITPILNPFYEWWTSVIQPLLVVLALACVIVMGETCVHAFLYVRKRR